MSRPLIPVCATFKRITIRMLLLKPFSSTLSSSAPRLRQSTSCCYYTLHNLPIDSIFHTRLRSSLYSQFRALHTSTAQEPMSTHVSSIPSSSPTWQASKVRSTFISYFEQNAHKYIPSSSTIPFEDPTLLLLIRA